MEIIVNVCRTLLQMYPTHAFFTAHIMCPQKKIEKKDTAKMKKVTYGAADSKGDKKYHLKTEEVDGGGRGKISSLEQFEFLIEYSAVCRKTSPIGMIVTLRTAAVAQLKDKPQLSRKVKTTKASHCN